jgi:phosphatidate cytidylyltransferase
MATSRERVARGRRAPESQRRTQRARRRNEGSDLGQRILAAIPASGFAVGIIVLGGWWFAAGAGLLGLICLHELFRMYERVHPVRLAAFAGLIGLVVAAELGDVSHVLLALAASFPLVFLLALAMPARPGPSVTASISITFLGLFWIGLAIAHAILLMRLPNGDGVLVEILVGTFLGDTGAYLGGRLIGTRPLAPRISPNKTVEGLVIGMLTAVAATELAAVWDDSVSAGQALWLGVAVAIAAPLGDLFESKIKRDAGTKDTGTLFGAHGGALDRLDAALFVIVAGYYVWRAVL